MMHSFSDIWLCGMFENISDSIDLTYHAFFFGLHNLHL